MCGGFVTTWLNCINSFLFVDNILQEEEFLEDKIDLK